MNNRENRATRAIAASASLLAIVFIAGPWVDEYLRLRRDGAELFALESEFSEAQDRKEQLDQIEAKLKQGLDDLLSRSIDPTNKETVRETLIEIVRKASGRIRRLEISGGEHRSWAEEGDDARNGSTPPYAEESRFDLYSHVVELQVDGSLEAIHEVLKGVRNQGWLMTTKGLIMTPTTVRESPVKLELRLVLNGLAPRKADPDDNFAQASTSGNFR